MRVFLKVKIKSLAEEARIIRLEEKKTKKRGNSEFLLNNLVHHRKCVVRRVTRNSLLAYGYMRGRSYAQIEGGAAEQPDWAEVAKTVKRFGGQQVSVDDLLAWKKGVSKAA